MNVNGVLSAANSPDALKQAVGIMMLDKIQSLQTAQVGTMLQDFQAAQAAVQAPHPYLGNQLDVRM